MHGKNAIRKKLKKYLISVTAIGILFKPARRKENVPKEA